MLCHDRRQVPTAERRKVLEFELGQRLLSVLVCLGGGSGVGVGLGGSRVLGGYIGLVNVGEKGKNGDAYFFFYSAVREKYIGI